VVIYFIFGWLEVSGAAQENGKEGGGSILEVREGWRARLYSGKVGGYFLFFPRNALERVKRIGVEDVRMEVGGGK